MKPFSSVSLPDPKSRSCLCSIFITVALICAIYFTGNAFLANDFRVFLGLGMNNSQQNAQCGTCELRQQKEASHTSTKCKEKCRPFGSEALPEGIVSKTSNLEMRPLWGDVDIAP